MKLPATHFLQRWFLGKFTVAIVMLGSIFGFRLAQLPRLVPSRRRGDGWRGSCWASSGEVSMGIEDYGASCHSFSSALLSYIGRSVAAIVTFNSIFGLG